MCYVANKIKHYNTMANDLKIIKNHAIIPLKMNCFFRQFTTIHTNGLYLGCLYGSSPMVGI